METEVICVNMYEQFHYLELLPFFPDGWNYGLIRYNCLSITLFLHICVCIYKLLLLHMSFHAEQKSDRNSQACVDDKNSPACKYSEEYAVVFSQKGQSPFLGLMQLPIWLALARVCTAMPEGCCLYAQLQFLQ